jgi:hypothetical protein
MVYFKQNNPASAVDLQFVSREWFILLVPFNKHRKELMEYHKGSVAISADKHTKLITALVTAVKIGDGSLDKEATSHDDLFDSFRLSLMLSLMFWN